jgi:1-acyl-sn-glycerol-3-phosphate acyltransferase
MSIKTKLGADIGSTIMGIYRALLIFVPVAMIVPLQLFVLRFGIGNRFLLPRLFHTHVMRILGIKIDVRGQISKHKPTLFVANHSSYLDIFVIGTELEGCFIAKAELAGWPIFGFLSKLQNTVFIERRARHAAEQRDELYRRLEAGDNLILFPEGTSSDGNHVLPFKSTLFGVVERSLPGREVYVQPISVTCTRLDGIVLGRTLRHLYSWYGDMTLVPHLWTMMKLGRFQVVLELHQPVTMAQFQDRKELSAYCHRQVSLGVERALTGRPTQENLLIAAPVS